MSSKTLTIDRTILQYFERKGIKGVNEINELLVEIVGAKTVPNMGEKVTIDGRSGAVMFRHIEYNGSWELIRIHVILEEKL